MAEPDYEAFQAEASGDDYRAFQEEARTPNPVVDLYRGGKAQLYNTGVFLKKAVTGKPTPPMYPPDTMAGRMGQVGVESMEYAVPMYGAATRVTRAAEGAGKARTFFQNMLSDMGVAFKTHPVRTTAIEGALGTTAGAGGFIAEENFPDSFAAQFVGEILGGFAPQAVPTALRAGRDALMATGRGLYKGTEAVLPIAGPPMRWMRETAGQLIEDTKSLAGDSTGNIRAGARLDLSASIEERRLAIQAMNDDLLAGLSPAAQTGHEELLKLEVSIDKELSEADKVRQGFMDDAAESIRKAIEDIKTGGDPEQTAMALEAAQKEATDLLDLNLTIAARKVEDTLGDISPNAGTEVANRTAYLELDKSYNDAVNLEKEFWIDVDQTATVSTAKSSEMVGSWVERLSKAEMDQLPPKARKFLLQTINGKPNPDFLGSITNVKELRGVQSQLREYARIQGGKGHRTQAKIASDVANAISKDLKNAVGVDPEILDEALNFSLELNQRYRQGTVGKILGYTIEGGEKMDPSIMLERTLGSPASRGAISRAKYDQLAKAADGSPEFKAAAEDYIRNIFFSHAVEGNVIDANKARTFLKNNAELMRRMPKVYEGIVRAVDAEDTRLLTEQMAKKGRVSVDNPKLSRATLFIQEGPEKAFNRINFMRDVSSEMDTMIQMAARDETGAATQGLKASFADWVVKNGTDRSGEISGGMMDGFMETRGVKIMYNKLFDAGERTNWDRIVNTAKRLDLQRSAKASQHGVISDTDKPGKIASTIARLLGVITGTKVGQMTGGHSMMTAAVLSRNFTDALHANLDPAKKLLTAAFFDDDLFRDVVLAKPGPDGMLPPAAQRKLDVWIMATFGDELPDEDEQ